MQRLMDRDGALIEALASGYSLRSRTVITTTGAGTYTPSAGTRALLIECVGGGGGGANAGNATTNQIINGGGGGGGSYSVTFAIALPGVYTTNVNAGGSGGAAAGNPLTSVINQAGFTLCSAGGGQAGSASASGTTELFTTSGGANTTGAGELVVSDNAGIYAHRVSGTVACTGYGAVGPHGGGPNARITHGNGVAGLNYGSGGSGAMSVSAGGATTGGHGGQGLIVIWEFS